MFLFGKQIIHRHYVREVTTVFVVFETVCRDEGAVYAYLTWDLIKQEVFSVYKFGMIRLVHREFLTVEFHFAQIVYVILAFDNQVNLGPSYLVVSSLYPC